MSLDVGIAGAKGSVQTETKQIGASDLPVISLGDSATLQVGEPIMAIGSPFPAASSRQMRTSIRGTAVAR